jgi:uncharacterized membrane protein
VTRTVYPVARWAKVTSLALSLAGLAISVYLTITHFEPQALVCAANSTFNCEAVTSSPQSYFIGVPVAVLGLGQYLVMTALNSPWAWRSRSYALHAARFVLSIVGMVFVLWLVGAELLIINHICLWCTGVHIVTFALVLVLVKVSPGQLGWSRPDNQPSE